jgi:hypothetical protein
MNWYKTSFFQAKTLEDRNILNKKIATLKKVVINLNYIVKYVFQNPPDSKKRLNFISNLKELSSFPSIIKVLNLAESKCLDNYKKASNYCEEAISLVLMKLDDLERERERFVNKESPLLLKRFRERYKK